ncbi:transposase family protein, partial [Escherichia sp. E10V4]
RQSLRGAGFRNLALENKLHWRLDVVMNEDDCKIRRGNAAELFSGIRHIAINILTNDKVFKAGLRRKMQKAGMDRNYLASLLAGSGLYQSFLAQ